MKPTLEQRCVAALTDDITAVTARALLDEVTSAIAQCKAEVAQAREQGFDPTKSPDAKAARERLEDAQFMLGRLGTLQSRLEVRHHELYAREQVAIYQAKRDKLQVEGDAVERELVDLYLQAVETIMEVFERATEFQQRAAQSLASLPPNTAALRKFNASTTRLLEKVTLLDLDGGQLWPLPNNNFAVAAVAAMSFPELAHGTGNPIGPGWELPEAQAQFRAEKDKQRVQEAKRYADMTEEQERRQNESERQMFAASQRR